MTFSPKAIGKIHFIGIGGIGMSGVAFILHKMGFAVTGSDQIDNAMTMRLKNHGIPISVDNDLTLLDQASLVVISSAINETHEGLVRAKTLGLPVIKRSEMLAEIMRTRSSIAVGGTHGKTTVTSLIATLLLTADLDPTIVSGGIINGLQTNAHLGHGEWVVAEADESDGSFIKLPCTLAVVTNIEPEHMDYYKTIDNLLIHFQQFLENISVFGLGIVWADDALIKLVKASIKNRRIVTYGICENADVQVKHVKTTPQGLYFDLHFAPNFYKIVKTYTGSNCIQNILLPMVGDHNMLNATAALIAGIEVGIDMDVLREGLQNFKGVNRRFTILGKPNNITVVDDYAHHPTEVSAVLKGAKDITGGRLIAVLQPHRYTRTENLFNEFSLCCHDADICVITPIYAAGEKPIPSINHHTLAKKMQEYGKTVYTVEDELGLQALIKKIATQNDCVICMGAGSITQWAKGLITTLSSS